jgi:hypothetical protein
MIYITVWFMMQVLRGVGSSLMPQEGSIAWWAHIVQWPSSHRAEFERKAAKQAHGILLLGPTFCGGPSQARSSPRIEAEVTWMFAS